MFEQNDSIEVMLSEEEIQARVAELGAQITRDFKGQPLHVIGVLKGSFVFLADLVRHIDLECSVDFLGLSSYGSRTASSGVVRMTQDLSTPIQGKHVLLVEDIVDTGLTMKYLIDNLQTRLPESISVCSLLHKPSNQHIEVPIHYIGFTIPNKFVIGYGLDYAELYRNLPFIGLVKSADALNSAEDLHGTPREEEE
jgi:hypoxanthine phosphoribosyltransferase